MSGPPLPLTVGVHQADADAGSPDNQLDRLRSHLSSSGERYDLMVCPELYLSGYTAGERFHELAETLDSPRMRRIQNLAVETQCAIAFGFPERTSAGLRNACAFVDRDGQLLAVHRKAVFPQEYEQRYFVPGKGPTIVDWCRWRIGILICYEVEFPEAVRACAVSGCDLVIVPTALTTDWPVVAQRVVPARAFENNLFIAYSNYCGQADNMRFLGESVVVDPFGIALVRAGQSETTLAATLDKARIAQARKRLGFLSDLERLGSPQYGRVDHAHE